MSSVIIIIIIIIIIIDSIGDGMMLPFVGMRVAQRWQHVDEDGIGQHDGVDDVSAVLVL